MTAIPYSKYSGAGNTFFLIDNRSGRLLLSPSWVSSLFNSQERETDGLIALESSHHADFSMRIFNPDGSEAEMCGNGLRTCVKFLQELGIHKTDLWIESRAHKRHRASCLGEEVAISMGDPHDMRWNLVIESEGMSYHAHFLNTGVPHLVFFLKSKNELDAFPVEKVGRNFRFHSRFAPAGTNVNFVYSENSDEIALRTYERGVERETQACGTGATAVALTAAHLFGFTSPLKIRVRSNEHLTIWFKKTLDAFSDVTLQGPAQKIEEGVFLS